MTTKTDTQAAFEKWLGARADDPSLPHGLMRDAFCAGVEAGRQGHVRDATKRAPSDDDLFALHDEYFPTMMLGHDNYLAFARALLSRHSSGQQGASAEPAVWVAADTLYSPHPRCVSSLAYVSQADQARGREYVPLAVITHKAAPVAQEPVAYLDLGAGGYMDVGTDLTDEQLAALPKGRHMLAIIGTYGVDGYCTAAPVAAQAQPVVNQSTEREVLGWYAEQVAGCRKIGSPGDAARHALDADGGEKARAALAQQPSGQDREDAADMFWGADDPERFGGDNLHDTLVDLADGYGDPDFPVTVRLQCAKRLPDVQVVVTGRNDDGELVYEVIDAAPIAAQEPPIAHSCMADTIPAPGDDLSTTSVKGASHGTTS